MFDLRFLLAFLLKDYGEWQTVEEATFEKDGLEERFCKGCNKRETRIVLKKNEQTYAGQE